MKDQALQKRAVDFINRLVAEYDQYAAQIVRDLCHKIESLELEIEVKEGEK